jgi:hypothetical protein
MVQPRSKQMSRAGRMIGGVQAGGRVAWTQTFICISQMAKQRQARRRLKGQCWRQGAGGGGPGGRLAVARRTLKSQRWALGGGKAHVEVAAVGTWRRLKARCWRQQAARCT